MASNDVLIRQLQARVAALDPPISGTPPTDPVDGQIWRYSPAEGIVWRFRYNQGSASAYKWEFEGGPSWSSVVIGGATAAPKIAYTLPFAGDWDLGQDFLGSSSPGGQYLYGQLSAGGGPASPAFAISYVDGYSSSASQGPVRFTGCAQGAAAALSLYSSGAYALTYSLLRVCPVRVG